MFLVFLKCVDCCLLNASGRQLRPEPVPGIGLGLPRVLSFRGASHCISLFYPQIFTCISRT